MGLWSRFAKAACPNMNAINESLDRLVALEKIQRDSTQWVVNTIAKQRDDARAALAARDAEVARLREALRDVAGQAAYYCGNCEKVVRIAEAALADPTATSDRGRE